MAAEHSFHRRPARGNRPGRVSHALTRADHHSLIRHFLTKTRATRPPPRILNPKTTTEIYQNLMTPATYPTLLPHQLRVVEERMQLDERRTALNEFIYRNDMYWTLPNDERDRLVQQLDIMNRYSLILAARIWAWYEK